MRENELSLFSKVGIAVLVAAGFVAALLNIAKGSVVHPRAFWIVLAGLILFMIGKVSVLARGR